MTCALEKHMMLLLDVANIVYRRPERDSADPTTLDFWLPDFNLYIEVKQFHTDRIAKQFSKVPERTTAILLQGPNAVRDFAALCRGLSQS